MRLTIGELAARTGVNAKTIRFYEQVGVLPPAGRTRRGYREYGPEAVERLRFIRQAQAAGLTLTFHAGRSWIGVPERRKCS